MQQQIFETNLFSPGVRYDPQTSTAHRLKVLGLTSENKRRYDPLAVREAAGFYEGLKVNIDHPKIDDQPDSFGNKKQVESRSLSERFGRLHNVTLEHDGVFADLRFNPEHSQAKSFIWWLENDPNAIGLSHNALGEGVQEADGTFVVKRIPKVFSVDVVADPATTKGLLEGSNMIPGMVADAALQRTRMNEMDPDEDEEHLEEMGQEGQDEPQSYHEMIGIMVMSIVNDPTLSTQEKREKIDTALELLDDDEQEVPAQEDDEYEDVDEDRYEDEDEVQEAIRQSTDPLVVYMRELLESQEHTDYVLDLCQSRGLPQRAVSEVFLEQLLCCDSEQAAIRLIEDRRSTMTKGRTRAPTSFGQTTKETSLDDFEREVLGD